MDNVPFANYIHPDDKDTVIDRHSRRLEGEKLPNPYSFRIVGQNNQEIWAELNSVGIFWEVILDMIMPDMDGGETYLRLKKINQNVKVLLSSGYSLQGQAQDILKLGGVGFIQKPFSEKELLQEIDLVLSQRG